jgi:hypothetical protein
LPQTTAQAPGASAPSQQRVDLASGIKQQIEAGKAPSRASMVNLLRAFGMKPQDANQEYDRQLAEWNRQQKG